MWTDDFTACNGGDCPKKKQCFRYMAPRGHLQSFFAEFPYCEQKDECEYFCPIYMNDKLREDL